MGLHDRGINKTQQPSILASCIDLLSQCIKCIILLKFAARLDNDEEFQNILCEKGLLVEHVSSLSSVGDEPEQESTPDDVLPTKTEMKWDLNSENYQSKLIQVIDAKVKAVRVPRSLRTSKTFICELHVMATLTGLAMETGFFRVVVVIPCTVLTRSASAFQLHFCQLPKEDSSNVLRSLLIKVSTK